MVHNESVNVWSHLIGVLFFFGLIYYTFIYMAPPDVTAAHSSYLDGIFQSPWGWFSDSRQARSRDSAILSNLLNQAFRSEGEEGFEINDRLEQENKGMTSEESSLLSNYNALGNKSY